MGLKYKISFIIIFMAIAFTPISLTLVEAESVVYIELHYGNEKFIYKDEFIEPSNHLVSEQVFQRRINAPLSQKLELIQRKLRGGASYKSAMLTCFPLLEDTVNEVMSKINRLPKDSEIRFNPSSKPMFTISREKEGVKVLEDRLYMDVYFGLLASATVKINVPIEKPSAQITMRDNIAVTNLRVRYSTDFSSSGQERKHNIALALSKINGAVLQSGAELSFNEKVGARSEKNGFKEAKIIKGGKYVPGVGGGVCQASTTLYNAALLGDLEIIDVHRHSLKISYELPSFDAMVNSGSSDLRIRNSGERPVFVRAYASGDRAYVEIYGTHLPYVIKRKSEVTFTGKTPKSDEIIDSAYEHFELGALSGERKVISYSHPEVHSNGYLLYYDRLGKLISTRLIRSDKYSAVKGTVAVAP